MTENGFIIENALAIDGGDDTVNEARLKHKAEFPGRSARRMTHLGIMVGRCLNQLPTTFETPIVYASAFAESRSLETFIESFPLASPALFQSSIHPSAIEQVLIPHFQAVQRFYPITSNANLAGQLLENPFMLEAERILLVGGEERGTWLRPFGLASSKSFALGLLLKRSGPGIGTLSLRPPRPSEGQRTAMLPTLAQSIAQRQDIALHSFALNETLQLSWS